MTEIPLNPDLPSGFFECDNQNLTPEERAWKGRVFIRETRTSEMPGGAVYAVYRLDAAEGFGPTRYDVCITLAQAQSRARAIGGAIQVLELF